LKTFTDSLLAAVMSLVAFIVAAFMSHNLHVTHNPGAFMFDIVLILDALILLVSVGVGLHAVVEDDLFL
jgi:uncharacterized membrane protein YphA (DoxX/SURF4 family)